MTPARTGQGKRATYRLNRVIPKVGRIQVSVGSGKLTDYRAAEALLTKLAEQGRLDLLRALKGRTITVRELRDADRREELAQAQAGIYLRRPFLPLARQLVRQQAWQSPRTKEYYEEGLDALERAGTIDRSTTVGELLELDWPRIERRWPHSAADWMRVRRTLGRVASLLFGDKFHPLRRQLMRTVPRRREIPREPTLTVQGFWQGIARLPEPMRPILCAIVGTGLRRKEMWGLDRADLRPAVHGIVVREAKGESQRFLELDPAIYQFVAAAVPIKLRYDYVLKRWQRALGEAGQPRTTLHDLRHCFGQWTLDQGVSDADVQQALGHKTPHQTRIYRMRQQRRAVSGAVAKVLGVAQSVAQPKNTAVKRKERKRA